METSNTMRVKGNKRFRDRHGKWRCYHRKTRKPFKAEFGTDAFFVELAELEEVARRERQAEAQSVS